MNFSEPGCSTDTNTSINITPLQFARSLFSEIETPITISRFTRHLTAIRDAAYLHLLPQTCRAEVEFRQAETARISNGPLGDAVLQASSLIFLNTFRRDAVDDTDEVARRRQEDIYETTDRMLLDLAAEQDRYLDNMALLLANMKEKWRLDLIQTGSWHHVAITLGESGIESARALSDLVGDRPIPPRPLPHLRHLHDGKKYLSEIARYWRNWGQASGEYEEVWTYVSGRALVPE